MVGCSGEKGKGEMEQYHNVKYENMYIYFY